MGSMILDALRGKKFLVFKMSFCFVKKMLLFF